MESIIRDMEGVLINTGIVKFELTRVMEAHKRILCYCKNELSVEATTVTENWLSIAEDYLWAIERINKLTQDFRRICRENPHVLNSAKQRNRYWVFSNDEIREITEAEASQYGLTNDDERNIELAELAESAEEAKYDYETDPIHHSVYDEFERNCGY